MPHSYQCIREPWFETKTYITLQNRPSEYQIRNKWQSLLREWMRADGSIAASLLLRQWVVPTSTLHPRRSTYLLQSTIQVIYHWHEDTYWHYQQNAYDPHAFIRTHTVQWTLTQDIILVAVSQPEEERLHLSPRYSGPLQLPRPPSTMTSIIMCPRSPCGNPPSSRESTFIAVLKTSNTSSNSIGPTKQHNFK